MEGIPYDPEHIASFFDDHGQREWDRFDASPMDRVNLEVHLRFLREYVRPGDRVLDAGAGPGRFTLELARLGATIVAGDISPRQLELHAEKTAEVERAVEARELLDIVDLHRHEDGSFDAVVCYGGRSATCSVRRIPRSASCCGSQGPAGTSSSASCHCSGQGVRSSTTSRG